MPHPTPRLQAIGAQVGAATGFGGRGAVKRIPGQVELLQQEQASRNAECSCFSGGCPTAKGIQQGAPGQARHVVV